MLRIGDVHVHGMPMHVWEWQVRERSMKWSSEPLAPICGCRPSETDTGLGSIKLIDVVAMLVLGGPFN